MANGKRGGLFARFSLDYADHPKIAGLSDAAFRAHVSMILYSRRYETDGVISKRVANRMGFQWDTDVLDELQNNDDEAPSLIQLENGDYMLHGYEEMQETKAEIRARMRRNAENGARGGRPRKTQSVTDSDTRSQTDSGTQIKAETETETELIPNGINVSEVSDETPRHDVTQILDAISEHCAAHGFKKPSRTKANTAAARLLIDADGHTLEQVLWIVAWVTRSEFWAGNIRSASKLREKFDQLKHQAMRDTASGTRPSPAAARRDETVAMIQRLQAEEDAKRNAPPEHQQSIMGEIL